jgi:hypothetical protein
MGVIAELFRSLGAMLVSCLVSALMQLVESLAIAVTQLVSLSKVELARLAKTAI